jgi:chemotaxis protein methyltransferase CheR
MGLMAEHGCADYGSFYRLASRDASPLLRDKIVDAMTTNETLWFRDGHPFEILKDKLLPDLARELVAGNRFRIRIWSGASSTGQEAYSIAMTILEYCRANPGLRPDQFEILGTDISPSALFLARNARYDEATLARGLGVERRNRFFHAEGRVWVANDEVKQLVTFRKFNLQDPLEPLRHRVPALREHLLQRTPQAADLRRDRQPARAFGPPDHQRRGVPARHLRRLHPVEPRRRQLLPLPAFLTRGLP